MPEYKGYFIIGDALLVHSGLPSWWRSQGRVFGTPPKGPVLIQSLDGVIFESRGTAEAHGLELSKKWIDENLKD
jgi:hypothetical protein